MAELLGKALASAFEQLAEECRARAEEAEAAMGIGADASREEDDLRPRAVSAGGNSDRNGNGKGAGDLGAPAKLVGSAETADCRSALRQRGSKCEPTRYVGSHLMLVVDNTRGH